MKETISGLRRHRGEAQIASAGQIHPGKCVRPVPRSPVVPPRLACAVAGLAGKAAGTSDTSAASLWRSSLAGSATDPQESLAYLLLAVGSIVSLLNGFERLDYFLINWPSFVELVQRVFS